MTKKKQHTDAEIIAALTMALNLMLEQELDFFNMKREEIKQDDGPLYTAKKAMIMADAWPDRKA